MSRLNKYPRGKVNIDGEHISYRRKRKFFTAPVKVMLFTVLIAIFCFSAGMAMHFYSIMHATSGEISDRIADSLGEDSPEYKSLKEQGHFNMLVLGEDEVEGSKRSDTILFVTVELDDKCVKIIALPRDTRVDIPGHGYHKLNSAFAFGGAQLLKTTIENYLNEPILYYLVVDYAGFPKLVDAFGGVEIDVKKKMRYVDHAGNLDINIMPGLQHMDGVTALHYVRFRKDALGDIGRVQRQQQFMKALLKKAYSPAVIARLPNIAAKTAEVFDTNMPVTLIAALAGFAKSELKRENIYMSTLYGTSDTIDGLSYWLGDPVAGKRFINASLAELQTGNSDELGQSGVTAGYVKGYSSADEEAISSHKHGDKDRLRLSSAETVKIIKTITQPVAVLNGSGESGVSNTVAQKLQQLGVDVIYKGNAKHYDYMYTNIIYPPDAQPEVVKSAKKLGELLNVPPKLIRPNAQAFYASVILGHDYKDIISLLDETGSK